MTDWIGCFLLGLCMPLSLIQNGFRGYISASLTCPFLYLWMAYLLNPKEELDKATHCHFYLHSMYGGYHSFGYARRARWQITRGNVGG